MDSLAKFLLLVIFISLIIIFSQNRNNSKGFSRSLNILPMISNVIGVEQSKSSTSSNIDSSSTSSNNPANSNVNVNLSYGSYRNVIYGISVIGSLCIAIIRVYIVWQSYNNSYQLTLATRDHTNGFLSNATQAVVSESKKLVDESKEVADRAMQDMDSTAKPDKSADSAYNNS